MPLSPEYSTRSFSACYREPDSNDDDDEQPGEKHSQERIQVCHLDSLKEAFGLRVPKKYTMERIMADEHRVVAMSRVGSESLRQTSTTPRRWFMSIFDLSGKDSCGGKTAARRFFRAERHIDLTMQSQLPPEMSLIDGWLILALKNELVWFDKKGKRSETSTQLDTSNVRAVFSSGSSIVFEMRGNKLVLQHVTPS